MGWDPSDGPAEWSYAAPRASRWLAGWHGRSLETIWRKGHAAYRRFMDYASNPAGVASALLAEVAARKHLVRGATT